MALRKKSGVTLVELMIALTIAAMVISGAVQFFVGFAKRNAQQQRNAHFQQEIAGAGRIIEGDIRMAGYGLSGNGVLVDKTTLGIDTVHLFSNEADLVYKLEQDVANGAGTINLQSAGNLSEGKWLCLADGTDTFYRRVQSIGSMTQVGQGVSVAVNQTIPSDLDDGTTRVYGADRISYYVGSDSGRYYLFRRKNDQVYRAVASIENIDVNAWNSNDSLITSNYDEAWSLALIFSGGGSGALSPDVRSDTVTSVIRNAR